jgi:nucleotide-binding universal stress UspA family protein
MKNILIVTDFSAASHNAGLYGIALAKQFNAKVFLFHAFVAPVPVPESYAFFTAEDAWKWAEEGLLKEAQTINPDQVVDLEICGREGIAVNAILESAALKNADIIICGMKATGKGIKKIFGSTITGLSKLSKIPLLIVPENVPFKKPENIALASDMDSETAFETIEILKEVGEAYHSILSVVWVIKDEHDLSYQKKFFPSALTNNLKDLTTIFEFPTGNNVVTVLDGFVKTHEIDLMAVIPHKHNFLESFIKPSTTRNMIFCADIPLLVLPQKKKSQEIFKLTA